MMPHQRMIVLLIVTGSLDVFNFLLEYSVYTAIVFANDHATDVFKCI